MILRRFHSFRKVPCDNPSQPCGPHPDALSVFKDSYLVEFLDLPQGRHDADLHQGLLQQLKHFLIELGRDCCFAGSEYPLQVGGRSILSGPNEFT